MKMYEYYLQKILLLFFLFNSLSIMNDIFSEFLGAKKGTLKHQLKQDITNKGARFKRIVGR